MPHNSRFAGEFDEGIIVRPEDQVDSACSFSGHVLDAAAGALVGMACGDALGVPYEYGTPPTGEAEMLGGGLGDYAPGEWSDDTQMAVCIARVAADGISLSSRRGRDEVAEGFEDWFASGPADVGIQTARVLEAAAESSGPARLRLGEAATALHARTGRTAGNGALMRTAPVALGALDDRAEVARSARLVAELTHTDALAGDSCVLWSEAIRLAITERRLDLEQGLDLLPVERREAWRTWILQAEHTDAGSALVANGFCVTALQAAWHAVSTTVRADIDPTTHIRQALQAAIMIGGDTDTVAAIAGSLLGARWGAEALPHHWRTVVHGWPGIRAQDLTALAHDIVRSGPTRRRH